MGNSSLQRSDAILWADEKCGRCSLTSSILFLSLGMTRGKEGGKGGGNDFDAGKTKCRRRKRRLRRKPRTEDHQRQLFWPHKAKREPPRPKPNFFGVWFAALDVFSVVVRGDQREKEGGRKEGKRRVGGSVPLFFFHGLDGAVHGSGRREMNAGDGLG